MRSDSYHTGTSGQALPVRRVPGITYPSRRSGSCQPFEQLRRPLVLRASQAHCTGAREREFRGREGYRKPRVCHCQRRGHLRAPQRPHDHNRDDCPCISRFAEPDFSQCDRSQRQKLHTDTSGAAYAAAMLRAAVFRSVLTASIAFASGMIRQLLRCWLRAGGCSS
jgi:hypothetical protein